MVASCGGNSGMLHRWPGPVKLDGLRSKRRKGVLEWRVVVQFCEYVASGEVMKWTGDRPDKAVLAQFRRAVQVYVPGKGLLLFSRQSMTEGEVYGHTGDHGSHGGSARHVQILRTPEAAQNGGAGHREDFCPAVLT